MKTLYATILPALGTHREVRWNCVEDAQAALAHYPVRLPLDGGAAVYFDSRGPDNPRVNALLALHGLPPAAKGAALFAPRSLVDALRAEAPAEAQ